jgi:hypothetical protein
MYRTQAGPQLNEIHNSSPNNNMSDTGSNTRETKGTCPTSGVQGYSSLGLLLLVVEDCLLPSLATERSSEVIEGA